jgi:hypothetical protein
LFDVSERLSGQRRVRPDVVWSGTVEPVGSNDHFGSESVALARQGSLEPGPFMCVERSRSSYGNGVALT